MWFVDYFAVIYISELAVAEYRGRLVSLYQLAITVGFLAAYLVNFQLLGYAESHLQAASSATFFDKVFINEI